MTCRNNTFKCRRRRRRRLPGYLFDYCSLSKIRRTGGGEGRRRAREICWQQRVLPCFLPLTVCPISRTSATPAPAASDGAATKTVLAPVVVQYLRRNVLDDKPFVCCSEFARRTTVIMSGVVLFAWTNFRKTVLSPIVASKKANFSSISAWGANTGQSWPTTLTFNRARLHDDRSKGRLNVSRE